MNDKKIRLLSQPVEFLLLLFASVEQLSPRHFAWWNDITTLKCDQDSKLSPDKKTNAAMTNDTLALETFKGGPKL